MKKYVSVFVVLAIIISAFAPVNASGVKVSGLTEIGTFSGELEEFEISFKKDGKWKFVRESVLDEKDMEYLMGTFSDAGLICVDSDITQYVSPIEAVPGSINFSFSGMTEGEYCFYVTKDKVFVTFVNGNESTLKQGFFEFRESGAYEKFIEFVEENVIEQAEFDKEAELAKLKNSVDISDFEVIYRAQFPVLNFSDDFDIGVCSYIRKGENERTVSAYCKDFASDDLYIYYLADVHDNNTIIRNDKREVRFNSETGVKKEYDYIPGPEQWDFEFQINVGDDMKAETITVKCIKPSGEIIYDCIDAKQLNQKGKLPADMFSAEKNKVYEDESTAQTDNDNTEEKTENETENIKEEELKEPEGLYYDKDIFESATAEGTAEIRFISKKDDISHGFGFDSKNLAKQKDAVEDFIDEFISLVEKGEARCGHSQHETINLDTYAYVNVLFTDKARYNKFEIEIWDNHLEFYSCLDDARKSINYVCDVKNIEEIREFLISAYSDELALLAGAENNQWNRDKKVGSINYDDMVMSFHSQDTAFKIMEKLEFDFVLDSAYEDTALSQIGKTGETVHGKIELLFSGAQYYVLTLSGSRGIKQFYHKETSWGFQGITGHRMTFETIYPVKNDVMYIMDNSKTKWDFIHINGDVTDDERIKLSLDYDYYSNQSTKRIAVPGTMRAFDVNYSYYGDEEFLESGRNLYTLFNLPEKEDYIQKKEKELTEYDYADALNKIGIFMGTDKGYELSKSLTRDESAAMLVRLLGKENDMDVDKYKAVFADVPKDRWSFAYIMYCYENGITKGTSKDTFSPAEAVTAQQFATLLLRLMGYNGTEPENALTKCIEVGILDEEDVIRLRDSGEFDRGNMVHMVYSSLSCEMANKYTLEDYLSMQGAITQDEAEVFDK